MQENLNLENLKTSWTKYDAVQVINVISSLEEIQLYLSKLKGIDEPILRAFLGINNLSDPLPTYWNSIQDYPDQKRLFALLAAIFTHHQNIEDFVRFSDGKMGGTFEMQTGKQYTNLRSILVESGASDNRYRKKEQVPYNFSPLYAKGEVGLLFQQLLKDRLSKIGWDGTNFIEICIHYNFEKALSLTREQFENWINGQKLVESRLNTQLQELQNFRNIRAYKVNQWLKEWDTIAYSQEEMRNKPDPYFLMFKIDARLLKRLSDVHRRSSEVDRVSDEPSLQRTLKESRSTEIHNYIHGGFPWSTISKSQQESDEYRDLKMPGMLPTAIIANILAPNSERGQHQLSFADSLVIEDANGDFPVIKIPDQVFEESWQPDLKPLEIIDGQHRLWAFDEQERLEGNYELPVIAYYNLDRAWQAYLFYTINIKPVKINTSLGYDLYPLLRTQKWLESSKDGLLFYRENRAQEVVEALWIYKESPWRGRIKMIGEGEGNISQAAYVKALTSSFLKKSGDRTNRGMGGLFSEVLTNGTKKYVLNWNRTQQSAFIIILWDSISKKLLSFINDTDLISFEPVWARLIRQIEPQAEVIADQHPAFTSRNSFLSRDQGVRGILMFANDFFFSIATDGEWDLNNITWEEDLDDKAIQQESIDEAIKEFKKHKIYTVILDFASEVIKLDWRTTSADFSDDPSKRLHAMQYKGSSGYSEVWKDLVRLFSLSDNNELKNHALALDNFTH